MRFNRILVTGIFLLSAIGVVAQSTNPSSPTPLTGQCSGKGPGKETNYYFSFTGGPGELSVRLDIQAKDYSTFARIEIGNDPSNLIAMHNMNASTSTGPASVVKKFNLGAKQTVRIRLTLDGNLAQYTLAVSGGSGFNNEGSGNIGKTSSVGKIGKLSTSIGSKVGSVGSNGKSNSGTQNSNGKSDITITCPTEVFYNLNPVTDWDGGLFGKKLYKFDGAGADGNLLSCAYVVNGAGKDAATIMRYAPTGYKCSVHNSGPKSRQFLCKPQAPTMDE